MELEEYHQRHHQDIPFDIFLKITNSTNKTYFPWLLDLYQKGNLPIETLYKATYYLQLYDKYKHLIDQDIQCLKSLSKLYSLIQPFEKIEESIFENEEELKLINQFVQVYKDDSYRIVTPLTLEAAQYFGMGTEWEVTNPNKFETYTDRKQTINITAQNIYILLPLVEDSVNTRFLIHFHRGDFKDSRNETFRRFLFFKENYKIFNFFNIHFPVNKYIDPNEFYVNNEERFTDNDKEAILFLETLFQRLKKKNYDVSPESVFYVDVSDNEKVYMEDDNSEYLSCRYYGFWDFLSDNYDLGFNQIRSLIKKIGGFQHLDPTPFVMSKSRWWGGCIG